MAATLAAATVSTGRARSMTTGQLVEWGVLRHRADRIQSPPIGTVSKVDPKLSRNTPLHQESANNPGNSTERVACRCKRPCGEADVMTHAIHATLTIVAAWALVASADELLLQPGHCGVTIASKQSCAHDSQSSGARKAASLRVCLRRCTSCPRYSVASYSSRDSETARGTVCAPARSRHEAWRTFTDVPTIIGRTCTKTQERAYFTALNV